MTLLKFRSWVAFTKVSIVVMTANSNLEHWRKEDLGVISGPSDEGGDGMRSLMDFIRKLFMYKGL